MMTDSRMLISGAYEINEPKCATREKTQEIFKEEHAKEIMVE